MEASKTPAPIITTNDFDRVQDRLDQIAGTLALLLEHPIAARRSDEFGLALHAVRQLVLDASYDLDDVTGDMRKAGKLPTAEEIATEIEQKHAA